MMSSIDADPVLCQRGITNETITAHNHSDPALTPSSEALLWPTGGHVRRVMEVSTSGFYAWRARPVSDRDIADTYPTNTIVDIHRRSRGSYSRPSPRPEHPLLPRSELSDEPVLGATSSLLGMVCRCEGS